MKRAAAAALLCLPVLNGCLSYAAISPADVPPAPAEVQVLLTRPMDFAVTDLTVRDVVVALRVSNEPPQVLGMVVEVVARRRIFEAGLAEAVEIRFREAPAVQPSGAGWSIASRRTTSGGAAAPSPCGTNWRASSWSNSCTVRPRSSVANPIIAVPDPRDSHLTMRIISLPVAGDMPVIDESAFVDHTAIICGKVVIGEGELLYPGGITAGQNEIFVSDSRHARIVSFTLDGKVKRVIGTNNLSAPRGLVVAGTSVLVADTGLRKVLRLGFDGRAITDVVTGLTAWTDPRQVN